MKYLWKILFCGLFSRNIERLSWLSKRCMKAIAICRFFFWSRNMYFWSQDVWKKDREMKVHHVEYFGNTPDGTCTCSYTHTELMHVSIWYLLVESDVMGKEFPVLSTFLFSLSFFFSFSSLLFFQLFKV